VATAAEDRLNIRRNPHIVWRASDVQTPMIDDKSLSPADRWLQSGSLLYFRDAILFACRSGKLQEALYSAGLEVYYWWCSLFRIRSRLIEFKSTHFWECCPEQPLDIADLAATLRLRNFSVVESPIKWKFITESANGTIFGTTHDRSSVLQRGDNLWSTPTELFDFRKPIFAIFISSSGHLFVATQGVVHLSKNGGRHFDAVLHLSHCDSTVWHNHGIDETPQGLIVIGEYGSIVERNRARSFWKSVAYLYVTRDDGESWRRIDYLARHCESKHVHLVKYSRHFRRLVVTDGDKRKQSYWIAPINEEWNFNEGRFDSFIWGGGHTAFAETSNGMLLGTDYRVAPNSIICLRSTQNGSARMLPSPYRRSCVLNMYSINDGAGSITFAYLNNLRDRRQSALIYSNDGADSWNRLIVFNGWDVDFSIANAQQGVDRSLVISFINRTSRETRTIIISVI